MATVTLAMTATVISNCNAVTRMVMMMVIVNIRVLENLVGLGFL